MPAAIVDTGPLVAFFDRSERRHRWTAERIEELDAPLLVCEPVLAEAMYLLGPFSKAQDILFSLLENEVIPTFYDRDENGVPYRWCQLMKASLATCAPAFNTVRILDDYVELIWRT